MNIGTQLKKRGAVIVEIIGFAQEHLLPRQPVRQQVQVLQPVPVRQRQARVQVRQRVQVQVQRQRVKYYE
jgi:hypothetical protein